MFFELVIIVIAAVVVLRQNSRIARIEKMLEGKPKESVVASASPAQAASSESVYQNGKILPPIGTTQTLSHEEASGRFLGKLGVVAVLVGVAFFLKYAFDNNWVGPSGRVMTGILFGLAFLVVGQMLRKKYLNYSDLVMGAGLGILYLSAYSAHSFYGLIDSFTTTIFMSLVTALAVVMSVVNATVTLSVVGVIGGFATPFLAGVHENNMLGLFGYLSILNIGVLGVSFFKKWPKLVVAAFIGAAINFFSWYLTYYSENFLAPTLFFLFLSFIIFVAASVARALTAGIKAEQSDYFLLGFNAFAFAVMGYNILDGHYHAVLGFGAVLIALVYSLVAYLANKYNPQDIALNIFLPGLAVVFLSVAVPLQFSGPWIAVAWFVESCFLYMVASIINNRGFQIMGLAVYAFGLVDFFSWAGRIVYDKNFTPIFNSSFAVLVLAIVVAYAIAYVYRKYGSVSVEIQKRGATAFVIIANVLTIYAVSSQVIFYHNAEKVITAEKYQTDTRDASLYNSGYDTSPSVGVANQAYYQELSNITNRSNTLVSIFWTLYAVFLTGIGFARRLAGVRRLGLVLFVVTAFKVVVDVWSLGQLYRIVSFTVFGVVALIASFAYAKYKDRLKEIV